MYRLRAKLGNLAALVILASLLTPQSAAATQSPTQAMFSDAAREFAVPAAVLMAVSYEETALIDHGAVPSFANGFGLMHLQENNENTSLAVAAQLLGVPSAVLKLSTRDNIRGGAAYLRHLYRATYPDDTGLSRTAELGRWYQPVARYLQSDIARVQRNYADAVFNTIGRGRLVVTPSGTLSLGSSRNFAVDRGPLETVPNDFVLAQRFRATGRYVSFTSAGKNLAPLPHAADREAPSDGWLTSPNYTAGRPWGQRGVVIHTCQSLSSTCQATLVSTTPPRKGAHFQVYSANGFREQYVHRWDRAWHCGECPWTDPNGNASSWNEIGVGIEHEGKTWEFGWYTQVMYARSAWVTAYTCYLAGWGGCDRGHVVGHSEVQPGNPDPGPYWDWAWYMYCVDLRYRYLRYGTEFYDCW